jgi:hypothetical protein
MKKLYVIGNGFDCHHYIKSSYPHFKTYLENIIRNNNPNSAPYKHAKQLLDFLNEFFPEGELWNNFEKALGEFDIDKYEQWYNKCCASTFNDNQSKQNYLDNLLDWFKKDITWNFQKWIQSLDKSIQTIKSSLNIDKSALFLTFNYTETLQKVYHVPEKQILHIHSGHDLKNERIGNEFAQYIIGHNKELSSPSKDHSDAERNAERDAREFIEIFHKDTTKHITENTSFWKALASVDEIFVLGHSLNEIDFPYFKEIAKSINMNNVQWKVSYYKEEDKKIAEDFVKKMNINSNLIEIDKIEKLCGINHVEQVEKSCGINRKITLKKYGWHYFFYGVMLILFCFSLVAIYNDAKDVEFCVSLECIINFKDILLKHSTLIGAMLSIIVAYIAYKRLIAAENDNKEKLKQFHFSEWRTALEARVVEIKEQEPFMIRVFVRERKKFFDKLYEYDFAIPDKKTLKILFGIFEKEICNFEKKTTHPKNGDSPASFLDFRFLFLGCVDDERLYEEITMDLEELYKNSIEVRAKLASDRDT